MWTRAARASALAVALSTAAGTAPGLTIQPGDILVLDQGDGLPETPARIIRIKPDDGSTQEVVTLSGGFTLTNPTGIAVDPDGQIYVAHNGDEIIRIDPSDGSHAVLTTGGACFLDVRGIEVEANGDVLGADPALGAVFRPSDCETPVASLTNVVDVALDLSDDIVLGDASGGIFQVASGGGTPSSVCPGGCAGSFLSGALSVAVDASGDILVVDDTEATLVRVDPISGSQTLLTSGGNLLIPSGVAIALDGTIVVVDSGSVLVIEVDPLSGTQVVFSADNLLRTPVAVAVAPIPEPATALLVACGIALLAGKRGRRRG